MDAHIDPSSPGKVLFEFQAIANAACRGIVVPGRPGRAEETADLQATSLPETMNGCAVGSPAGGAPSPAGLGSGMRQRPFPSYCRPRTRRVAVTMYLHEISTGDRIGSESYGMDLRAGVALDRMGRRVRLGFGLV